MARILPTYSAPGLDQAVWDVTMRGIVGKEEMRRNTTKRMMMNFTPHGTIHMGITQPAFGNIGGNTLIQNEDQQRLVQPRDREVNDEGKTDDQVYNNSHNRRFQPDPPPLDPAGIAPPHATPEQLAQASSNGMLTPAQVSQVLNARNQKLDSDQAWRDMQEDLQGQQGPGLGNQVDVEGAPNTGTAQPVLPNGMRPPPGRTPQGTQAFSTLLGLQGALDSTNSAQIASNAQALMSQLSANGHQMSRLDVQTLYDRLSKASANSTDPAHQKELKLVTSLSKMLDMANRRGLPAASKAFLLRTFQPGDYSDEEINAAIAAAPTPSTGGPSAGPGGPGPASPPGGGGPSREDYDEWTSPPPEPPLFYGEWLRQHEQRVRDKQRARFGPSGTGRPSLLDMTTPEKRAYLTDIMSRDGTTPPTRPAPNPFETPALEPRDLREALTNPVTMTSKKLQTIAEDAETPEDVREKAAVVLSNRRLNRFVNETTLTSKGRAVFETEKVYEDVVRAADTVLASPLATDAEKRLATEVKPLLTPKNVVIRPRASTVVSNYKFRNRTAPNAAPRSNRPVAEAHADGMYGSGVDDGQMDVMGDEMPDRTGPADPGPEFDAGQDASAVEENTDPWAHLFEEDDDEDDGDPWTKLLGNAEPDPASRPVPGLVPRDVPHVVTHGPTQYVDAPSGRVALPSGPTAGRPSGLGASLFAGFKRSREDEDVEGAGFEDEGTDTDPWADVEEAMGGAAFMRHENIGGDAAGASAGIYDGSNESFMDFKHAALVERCHALARRCKTDAQRRDLVHAMGGSLETGELRGGGFKTLSTQDKHQHVAACLEGAALHCLADEDVDYDALMEALS
jgi:hypothetical protein